MSRGRVAALLALGALILGAVLLLRGGSPEAPVVSSVSTPPLQPEPLPVRTGLTAAATGGFAVSGEIRTAEGAPVEGAEVVWSDDFVHREAKARTTSRADGSFELHVPKGGIVWVAEGASPELLVVKKARTDLFFEQPETCPARLRVVDTQGAAVPGFQVSLKIDVPRAGGRGSDRGDSLALGDFAADRSGWIELPRLLCAPVQVTRRDPRQHPIVGGRLDPTLDRELELVVEPGARLRGRIETEDGAPVAGEELFIQAGRDKVVARTDAEGAFEVQTPGDVDLRLGLMSAELGFPDLKLHSPPSGDWQTTWVVEAPRVVMVDCGSLERCISLGFASCEPESGEPFGGGHCLPASGTQLRCTCPEGDVRIEIAGQDSLRVPAGASTVDLDAPQEPVVEGEVVAVTLPVDHGGERDPYCSVEWKTAAARDKVECGQSDTVTLELPPDEALELKLWCHGRAQRRELTVSAGDERLPAMSTVGTASAAFTLVSEATGAEVTEAHVSLRGLEGAAAGVSVHSRPNELVGGVARFRDLPAGAWKLLILTDSEAGGGRLELDPGDSMERELTLRSFGR